MFHSLRLCSALLISYESRFKEHSDLVISDFMTPFFKNSCLSIFNPGCTYRNWIFHVYNSSKTAPLKLMPGGQLNGERRSKLGKIGVTKVWLIGKLPNHGCEKSIVTGHSLPDPSHDTNNEVTGNDQEVWLATYGIATPISRALVQFSCVRDYDSFHFQTFLTCFLTWQTPTLTTFETFVFVLDCYLVCNLSDSFKRKKHEEIT